MDSLSPRPTRSSGSIRSPSFEIAETQDPNSRHIMRAIVDTGFKGYVAQEFVPRHDPLASLRQAIKIYDL